MTKKSEWVDDYRRSKDASMTREQLSRAELIAESREIDYDTACELVYLRDAQREGGSVSTTEGATVPSQPSPESAAKRIAELEAEVERQAAFAKANYAECIKRDKRIAELESLTPDVQGKLAAAIRRVLNKLDDPHLSVTAVDADALREALALLNGQR